MQLQPGLLFRLAIFVILFAFGWSQLSGPNVCSYSQRYYYRTAMKTATYSKTQYTHKCGTWGWSRCHSSRTHLKYGTNYREVAASRVQYRCCQGWTLDKNKKCLKAICSPACQNGGRCFAPNECDCPPTHEGPRCTSVRCSYQTPCYPGGCDEGDNQRCKCPVGFSGSSCLTLKRPVAEPVILWCNLEILGEDGKVARFPACMEGNSHKTELFARLESLKMINTSLGCLYDPPMFSKPTYIHSINLGITGARLTAVVYTNNPATNRTVKKPVTLQQQSTSPCGNNLPTAKASCNFLLRSKSYSELKHKDRIEIVGVINNGGKRTLFNSSKYLVETFTGLTHTLTTTVVIDQEAPEHCSDYNVTGTPCTSPYVAILHDPTADKPHRFSLSFPGWKDDVSGLASLTYNVIEEGGMYIITQGELDMTLPDTNPIYFEARPGETYAVGGNFTDVAGNRRAVSEKLVHPREPTPKPQINPAPIVGVSVGAVVLTVILIISVLLILHARGIRTFGFFNRMGRCLRTTSDREDEDDFHGLATTNLAYDNMALSNSNTNVISPEKLNGLDLMEVESRRAQFADFYVAELRDRSAEPIRVVLKVLKELAPEENVKAMEERVRILAAVGGHPNIVKLHGITAIPHRIGPTMVLGACDLGSLNNWLQTKRNTSVNEDFKKTLTALACGIADGMAHLHALEVRHNKLTSSNILLVAEADAPPVPKLVGFGQTPKKLPNRWMAPEVLQDMSFSDKADVWSYAMVLTEIYSLGAAPWAVECASGEKVLSFVKGGGRISRPRHCDDDMFTRVIEPSMTVNPADRPSFDDVIENLKQFVGYAFVSGADDVYYAGAGYARAPDDGIYYDVNTGPQKIYEPLNGPPEHKF